MFDWMMVGVGCIMLLVAFVGCVVPCLPGPVLGWGALLALAFTRFALPTSWLVIAGVATVLVLALDYIVPALGAKKFSCSKWGVAGCTIGTIAGIFFMPLGIILGPFLGACAGELIAGRTVGKALKGGLGAFLGFLSGVFLKLCAVGAFAGLFAWCVFSG